MDDFFKRIEEVSSESRHKVMNAIIDTGVDSLSFEFVVNIGEESVSDFGLNSEIMITQHCTPELVKTKYYYKGVEVSPDCYYLRPEEYHPVTTLRILQECINQDKHNPDIKYLERGEEELQS